ncbi:hypothetical protein ATE92_0964 [Ulvibacter sp. MAR_2010_11]|uniref:hypothetical protein n=1 Tax=Ulvibacter sp. MAR_2010_11 TaxID=1250229 RepID=UPI000C2BF663|nr:hypothetical protein [Ulvibacter sp. MAR_2010_11]PKA82825.1 hypothetical protein ATE92_0964 [Ulvibacter sp. MAR_2010_11]
MKFTYLIIILITIQSCNNAQKSDVETLESTTQLEEEASSTKEVNKIELQQKGDYSRLFAKDSNCKLSLDEVATIFALSSGQIKTNIEEMSPCRFNITYRDGGEGYFAITVSALPNKSVQKEIENKLSNSYQKDFIKKSDTGDHYIFKHPNQGYLLLLNPNYDNVVKIQYRTMLVSDLTQTQLEILEQRGYHTANYLIAKYQD